MESCAPGPVDFLTALKQGPLVFDGAMGTALYARGFLYSECFEELSRRCPRPVVDIHRVHREAGAQVLITNTFGANAYRLRSHGLESQVAELNLLSAKLARKVQGHTGFVLGSIGPTGLVAKPTAASECEAIVVAFAEQAHALQRAQCDGLILETFRTAGELQLALRAIRERLSLGLPVVASLSLDRSGTTADGVRPEELADNLAHWGADAIGVNCAEGPEGVLEAIARLGGPGLPRVARPNAGLPRRTEQGLSYPVTPAAFREFAREGVALGVHGLGGCCGTTPAHIQALAAVVTARDVA